VAEHEQQHLPNLCNEDDDDNGYNNNIINNNDHEDNVNGQNDNVIINNEDDDAGYDNNIINNNDHDLDDDHIFNIDDPALAPPANCHDIPPRIEEKWRRMLRKLDDNDNYSSVNNSNKSNKLLTYLSMTTSQL
jgi:hypothetical protein